MPSTFLWLPKRRQSQAVVNLDDCGETKGKRSFFSKPRRGRRLFSAALGGGASHAQAAEGTSSSLGPEQGILRGQPTLFVDPRQPSPPPHSPPPHAHFFASSYDLTRCPSTSFALRSSVDFTSRRPTSVAFAHPQPWSAFAETSEDLFDDGDYPYQYEENPAQTYRGDFRSRAKLTCQSVLSLVEKTGILSRNLRAEGMKSEVWASSSASGDMTTPPPVPGRSRLRAVPTPKLDNISPTLQSPPSFANNLSTDELSTVAAASTRGVTHGQASLYNELSTIPSPRTPNLTSPSMPCFATSPSSLPRSPLAQDFPHKGKRRSSKGVERDPYKVKDGVGKKQSSSGVYTPTTYPGPCGPRPSHYPSHVYTPPNFALHSRRDSSNNPISPSSSVRSSSSDHSDSTAPPGTPITPTGRFGKALTSHAKRLSTMAGLGKGRKDLERDSYFPSSTTASFDYSASPSRQSSWGHSGHSYHDSPSGYFYPSSQGLGFGIEEELQLHSVPTEGGRPQSVATVMGLESGAEIRKTAAPVRGRRKPVPNYEEDEIVEKVQALEV